MTGVIPRVDLEQYRRGSEADRRRFVAELGAGISDVGFAVISGHGIDAELASRCYGLFARFFALSEAQKARYVCKISGNRGYSPLGRERAKGASAPDLKEFWHVCQELPPRHPGRDRYLPNIWPGELPELEAEAMALYRSFEACAALLLQALGEHFGLPLETLPGMMRHGNSVLRVIHYPPLQEEAPAGAVRAAAHEDINLITLLIESRGGGLEILTRDGSWEPVNALAGDLIVDSGDMLSRLSNGVIPATTHRVVNPVDGENCSRYSMPFFVHPFPDTSLGVLDEFVSEERPARFEEISADAFLTERLKAIGLIPHSGRLRTIDPLL